MLCGIVKFSLNDLYTVCIDWAEQARDEPEAQLPAWPGLAAAAQLVSSDKSLAKDAIFSVVM